MLKERQPYGAVARSRLRGCAVFAFSLCLLILFALKAFAAAPTITSISPTSGPTSGGTSVTITGSSFVPKNTGGDSGWATVAGKTLPGARRSAQQVVIGNTIYFFGGYTGTASSNAIFTASTSDPTTWINTGKTLPGGLAFSNLAVIGGNIYLFGGFNAAGAAVNVIYRAPVSDPTTWVNTGKTIPGNSYSGEVAVVGNSVYLYGGYNGAAYTNVIYSASTSDPTTWVNTGKTLPSLLYGAQLQTIGSSIYLFGGYNGAAYTGAVYSASTTDPTTWINTGKTLPAPAAFAQSMVVGDYVYLFGGSNGTAYTNTIYRASIIDPTTWVNTGLTLSTALGQAQVSIIDSFIYFFGGYIASETSAIYRAPLQRFRSNVYNPSWTTNWVTAPDLSNVTIGGVAATNINFASSTAITATTPAHALGATDVVVTNYDGQTATLTATYTYSPPPSIASVTPNSVLRTGGNAVTITGSNFVATPTVTFGGVAATSVTFVNSTTLSVITPVQNVGTYDVVVTNPDGQLATLSNSITFTDPPPSISSITPTGGPTIGGTSVTITGSNFVTKNTGGNTGWTTVVGKTLPTNLYLPQQAVIGNNIYLFGGNSGSVTNSIYSASTSDPTTWINTGKTLPAALAYSQLAVVGNSIYLFGGFNGTSAVNVIYAASTSNPTTWINTGKTIPSNLYGAQVAVVGNSVYLYGGYTGTAYNTAIYSASTSNPTTWINTGKTMPVLYASQVAIIGSQMYLFGGDAGANTYTNAIYSASTTDPTTWFNTGKTLPAVGGWSQVAVVGDSIYMIGGDNGSPKNTIYQAFVSDPTTWTSVGQGTLPVAELPTMAIIDNYIYLFGGRIAGVVGTNAIFRVPLQHFRGNVYNQSWKTNWSTFASEQSNVTIGGISATNVNFLNSTTITASTSASTAGTKDVVVTSYDGQSATLVGGYTYAIPPSVTSLSPNSVTRIGGSTVTITGSGFNASSAVTFGGISVQSVSFVNSTTLTVITPVIDTGQYDVIVTNPDGQTGTLSKGITIVDLPPGLSSIIPNNGPTAGGTSITVNGANFIAAAYPTGGIVTTDGLYTVHTFNSSGTFNSNGIKNVEVLVVGGGGGGTLGTGAGVGHGGGGAGGLIYNASFPVTSSTSIPVTIGAGGGVGANGANSVFSTLTAIGGGRGGAYNFQYAGSGGSSGGELNTAYSGPTRPTAVPGQGNIGGFAPVTTDGGGGGGGAGGPGLNGFEPTGGAGGIGLQYSISGTSTYYAGGGGGSPRSNAGSGLGGVGGLGGGGHGSNVDGTGYSSGVPNTGGGGGASRGTTGGVSVGTGGSGVVVVRYLTSAVAPPVVTIGGSVATNVVVTSPTSLTASTTAHAAGVVDVIVTNRGGQGATLPASFTYGADRLVIISSPLSQREGQPGVLTIQAQDSSGNAVAVATSTTVQLLSTAPTGFFARDLNEDIATRWNYNSVIIPAGQTSVNFYYFDNLKGTPTISISAPGVPTGGSQQETIVSKYRFLVTGVTNPVKQGIPSSVTFQSVDYNGVPLHDYTGTVHFTSTDGQASLPPDFVVTPAMLGGFTFVNGITMLTQGTWCVTMTDTNDANIVGSQCGIVVGAPNVGTPTQLKFITSPQFVPVTGTSTPITVQVLNTDGVPVSSAATTTVYIYTDSGTALFSKNGTTGWAGAPLILTIRPGLTSVNFYYRDTTLGAHTITASDDSIQGVDFGLTNDTQTVTSTTGGGNTISVVAATHSLQAGTSTAVTVTLKDSVGNSVASQINQPIFVSASGSAQIATSTSGPWSSVISTIINVGQTGFTIYARDSLAQTFAVTASDFDPPDGATGLIDGTDSVSVLAGPATTFSFSTPAYQVTAGAVSGVMTLQMLDQFGNLAIASSSTNVYLYSDQIGGLFSASSGFSPLATSTVIAAGQSSVGIYFKQSTYLSAPVTISASDNAISPDGAAGIADATQVETIVPGAMFRFVVTNAPPITGTAGDVIPVTVAVQNSFGLSIPFSSATTLYLRTNSSSSSHLFSLLSTPWSPVTSFIASIGATSTTLYYKDTGAGAPTITFADEPVPGADTGILNATSQISIGPAAADTLSIISTPFSIEAGQVSPAITLRLQDQYGNASATTTSISVALSSTGSGGGFATTTTGDFTTTNIVILSGQTSATLYYKDTIAGTPTISMTATGFAIASQQETINWGTATALRLSIANATTTAGIAAGPITAYLVNSSGGTVPAISNFTVNLSSSAAGTFDASAGGAFDGSFASFIIAQNATSSSFFYKDTKVGQVNIIGAGSGPAPASLTISIISSAAAHLGFVPLSGQTLEIGQKSTTTTVFLYDQFDNIVTAATTTVIILSTNSGQGTFLNASNQTITQVSIPAGQSGASFTYRDLTVGSSVISAHTSGLIDAIVTETIIYGAPTSIVLTASSTSLTAGSASGPILANLRNSSGQLVPAQGATAITLASNALTGRFDTSAGGAFDGSVTSATIPDGQFSIPFYYLDTLAGSPTVTASKSGLTSGTIGLNVTAAVPSQIVFINPLRTSTAGAASLVFTVQFRDSLGNVKVLTSPVTVDLSTFATSTGSFATNVSGPWTVTSITVSAGASSGNFFYKDTLSGTKAITISSTGLTGASQNVTIIGGPLNHFKFTSLPQSIAVLEQSGAITIGAFDAFENVTAPASNLMILLTSTSTQYQFSTSSTAWNPVTSVIFPSGQNSVNFYYKDWHPGNPVITARDQVGTYPAITQTETVTSGDASALSFSTVAQTTVVNTPSGQVGIRLLDSAGNQVFATVPVTVNVSGDSPTALFSDDFTGNPGQATFPVSFAPGDSIHYFYYKDSAAGTLQVSLAASGFTGATQNETIVLGTPAQIVMTSALTIPAGQPVLVTLEARTSGGLPVAVQSPITIPLSDNLAGQFSLISSPWTPVTSITIPAGSSQKTFFFRSTTAGTHTLTANGNGAGLGTATDVIDVLALNVYQLKILSGPATIPVNQPSTAFTVQTQDQYGNIVSINSVDTGGGASVDVFLYGIGQFALLPIGPWGIPSVSMQIGDNTFTIYYMSPTPGAQTITVSDQALNTPPDTGWVNGTWPVNVAGDTPAKVAFTTPPQSVVAGARALITIEAEKSDNTSAVLGAPLVVSLGATWTGGQFSLSSTATSSPITQVTIPTGQSSVSFYAYNNLAGTYTLSLAATGLTGATQQFIVRSGPPSKLVFLSAPQSVPAGSDSTIMRVQMQDQLGNAATSSTDTAVNFSSTDSGQFSMNPTSTWLAVTGMTIPAGSSDSYFYFRNASLAGTYQLSVSDASAPGLTTAIQNVTVTAGNVSRLKIVSAPFTVIKGQISPTMTLVYLDQFGNITSLLAPSSVYLYSTSASGAFSTSAGFTSTTLAMLGGLSSATFYYKDTTGGTPLITISDRTPLDAPDIGLLNDAQTETINEGSPYQIRFIDAATAIVAGGTRAFIAELENQYGEPVAPISGSLTTYLYSTSLFGRFSLTNAFQPGDFINNFQFNPSETQKTFYYRDTTAGAQTITASDQTPLDAPDIGLVNAVRTQSVLSASVYSLNFLNAPQALETGGVSSALTVGLRDQFGNSVAAPVPIDVYLYTDSLQGGFATSSNASTFTVTQTTIPLGASTLTLYYKDLAVGTPTITVSDATPLDAPDIGVINAVQTESVTIGNIFRIAFTTPPQTLEMGEISQKITVEFENSHGAPRPVTSDTLVYLTSSNAQGQFSLSPAGPWTVTSVTVLSGQASADLYYRQISQGGATLTASDATPPNGPIGLLDGTQSIGVLTGVPSQIIISSPATVISRHPSTPITITIQNAHGVAASSSTMTRLYIRSSVTDETDEFSQNILGPWGINYVDLPAGDTQISFYFRGISTGTRTISVSDELPALVGVGLTNADSLIEIVPQTMDHFLVTNISDPQIQGQASSVIVEPQDAQDYLFVDYAGSICFSASDADAILPGCYTFDPSVDHGIHTFGNGVAFLSAGEKTVHADDSVGGYTGRQDNITVRGNTAGSLAKVKFLSLPTQPVPVPKNLPYGPLTIGLFDLNDQTANAPTGGYQVLLTSDSATALFSSSPNGPWTSVLVATIPAGLSSINFYYKDGSSGTFTITGNDWAGNQNNPLIQDDTFTVQMSGLLIQSAVVLQSHDAGTAAAVTNPILFSNDSTRNNLDGRAILSVVVSDEITGAPVPSTLKFILTNPTGTTLRSSTTPALNGTATFNEYPIPAAIPADSGNWIETIVATDSLGRISTTTVPMPVSHWRVSLAYNVGFVQLGTPVFATLTFMKDGATTSLPAGYTFDSHWLYQQGTPVIGAPGLTRADIPSAVSPGVYQGNLPTGVLSADVQYHGKLTLYDDAGVILGQDSHADIQIVNNPALAPKNFAVEKILTSVPPAPERYNLKFTWDMSPNATSYNLYRTQDRFARLYDDPCTIAQVQNGDRTAGVCEKTIDMAISQNFDETNWALQDIEPTVFSTNYTLVDAQDRLSGKNYYFVVRANNGLIESGLSSLIFVNKLAFNYNATGATNVNWIGIPFLPQYYTNPTSSLVRSPLNLSSVAVRDIEGGVGLNTNQKIKRVSLWDAVNQGVVSSFIYRTGGAFNRWTNADFTITPGSGIFLEPSGNIPIFSWTTIGNDTKTPLTFTYNGPSATNVYWVSLPYSGMYKKASDIVKDIEGGTGLDTNQKIKRVSLWDPISQGVVSSYIYRTGGAFNRWTNADFDITPGSGVFIELSGLTPTFQWTPALIVEPNQ